MPTLRNTKLLICCLLVTVAFSSYAQKGTKKVIQFSGIVVSGNKDSISPIPFVNIVIKGSKKGCITDFVGFFSIPVESKDTIEFSALGYKKSRVVIPDTIKGNKYSEMRRLTGDTVLLRTAIIRPWPPLDQFKQVFLAKKVPDDDFDRAKKNLERASRAMQFTIIQDGSISYKGVMQQRNEQSYYAGQLAPNRLLDPLAWGKLIDAWKKGELKIETSEQPQ